MGVLRNCFLGGVHSRGRVLLLLLLLLDLFLALPADSGTSLAVSNTPDYLLGLFNTREIISASQRQQLNNWAAVFLANVLGQGEI